MCRSPTHNIIGRLSADNPEVPRLSAIKAIFRRLVFLNFNSSPPELYFISQPCFFHYPEPQGVAWSTVQPNHSRVTKYQFKALQLKWHQGLWKIQTNLTIGTNFITRTINGHFSWRKYCIWSYDLPTDQILNCPPLSRITWPNAIYCHFSSTGGTRRHHFLQESHLCPLLLLTYEYRFKGKLPPTAHFSSLFILFMEGAGHVWALCDHTALGPL